MPTKTPAKSGRAKSAAARAETNGKPKTATFRGLKLKLPSKMGVEVGYAYADLESAGERIKPYLDFIESLIGPEQFAKVKAKQARDGVAFDELADDLNALTEAIFSAYGTNTGESSASSAS